MHDFNVSSCPIKYSLCRPSVLTLNFKRIEKAKSTVLNYKAVESSWKNYTYIWYQTCMQICVPFASVLLIKNMINF